MNDDSMFQLNDLILRTPSAEFLAWENAWREALASEFPGAPETRQHEIAEMLAENALDLRSVLPDWRLKCWEKHPHSETCAVISDDTLAGLAEENLGLLRQWGRLDLLEHTEAQITALGKSNLVALSRMTFRGEANTYWGNDYAMGLREAMRRGACLVTTNPVLINVARKEYPDTWTPVRDQLRRDNPKFSPVELAYAMTIQVVARNARLMRPVWEITEGRLGYVSLQLSPECATDAERMISEAKWVWSQLEEALGGTPNCVFKVPGTKAGIEVAGELTASAIGVNITVTFALPQQIAFAGIIQQKSIAPVSFRTQMDGRLDDPVGEEMQAAGVSDWEEVKQWCTTAMRQREYRLLSKAPSAGGVGLDKSCPLGAAGRGPWNILRSIHREPEVPTFITIFPNRQDQFDSEPRELNPDGMWTPLPDGHLDKLYKSRLFRQAFEPDGLRPEEFETYPPAVATLTQFCESYQEFLAWLGE